MSNNPQWKTFHPPIMNSDPAILDYKSMSISTKSIISESQQTATNNYRDGSNYCSDRSFMGSPDECGKNSSSFSTCSSNVITSHNDATRFSDRTLSSMDIGINYTTESTTNNSIYQDQSGPREAGIIEKLLVNRDHI